jgi:aminopeptidase YwaD
MLLSLLAAAALTASPGEAHRFAESLARRGPRPAASAAERRAHQRVARRFDAAGLRVARDRFRVPGIGRSRNVYGVRDVPGRECLRIAVAHIDTAPPSPGAEDNASGVGALVALAPVVAAAEPRCDVWLVASGGEERIYTGRPDHLGALAVVRRLERQGRAGDLRYALSLDEVGSRRAFWLRSPAAAPRPGVERALLASARRAGVTVRWVRDEGDPSSDHREFALAGLPAMKLGVPDNPARHTARDRIRLLRRGAFRRSLAVVEPLLVR